MTPKARAKLVKAAEAARRESFKLAVAYKVAGANYEIGYAHGIEKALKAEKPR